MCKRLDEFLKNQMSANDFAKKIDVDPVSVSRYRRGEKTPVRSVMTRIAIATGGFVMPNDFWDGEIPPRIFAARYGKG